MILINLQVRVLTLYSITMPASSSVIVIAVLLIIGSVLMLIGSIAGAFLLLYCSKQLNIDSQGMLQLMVIQNLECIHKLD